MQAATQVVRQPPSAMPIRACVLGAAVLLPTMLAQSPPDIGNHFVTQIDMQEDGEDYSGTMCVAAHNWQSHFAPLACICHGVSDARRKCLP